MSNQLELSQHELEAIGFKGHYAPPERYEGSRVWYSIPFFNGEFLYNVENAPFKWYMRNNNGSGTNNNLLDITKLAELYVILSCFKVEYNPVIF